MKLYDITVPLHPDLTIWPGDPPIEIKLVADLAAGDVANVTHLNMTAHSGTHIDAPRHFLADGKKTADISLETLIGPALVVELSDEVNVINAEVVKQLELPASTHRLLFKTRNRHYWPSSGEELREDFVGLDDSAAQELVDLGVMLVGVDYLSVAAMKAIIPTHEILLKAGVVLLEGIDLREVPADEYILTCLPMKLADSEGAPVRAVLSSVSG